MNSSNRSSLMSSGREIIMYKKIVIIGDRSVGKNELFSLILKNANNINNEIIKQEEFGYLENKIKLTINTSENNTLSENIQLIRVKTINNDFIQSLIFKCKVLILMFNKKCYQTFAKAKTVISTIERYCLKNTSFRNLILVGSSISDSSSDSENVSEGEIIKLTSEKEKNLNFQYINISSLKELGRVKNEIEKIIENSRDIITISPPTEDISGSYKVILLGDSSVGKTSFFRRFFLNDFNPNFLATLGLTDSFLYVVIDSKVIKIQVWDTAGQDRFRSIPKKYYEKVDGAILMYDITNKASFEGITKWTSDIHETTDNVLATFLVGNKLDLIEERKVSYEEGYELAEREKMKFLEVSAKLDLNIREVMIKLVDFINRMIDGGRATQMSSDSKLLERPEKRNKKICCI